MVLINKIALLTTICFIIISCTVDVNQPLQVEENYVINARDIFDSLVYHIGWKTQNNRFALRVPTDEKSYVDLTILSIWEFVDDAVLDDVKGNYKLDVYIQGGQEDKIKDTTLSHAHRLGIEKRIYYSNGVFEIQNIGALLTFVFFKEAATNWNKNDEKFESVDPGFGTGDIIVFGDHLSLISSLYTLAPIEKKEKIINGN